MEQDDVRTRAVNAVKWTTAAEAISRFLQPLAAIILVRLLSPVEFGIVGVAVMVISFSQIFWEAGLGKAIIQAEKEVNATANVTFWTNIVLSAFVYLLIFTAAPKIGNVYGDPVLTPVVLRVLGIQVVIQAFSLVQSALFQRVLNYRVLFYIRLIAACMPIVITIPLALMEFGVWSLVIGTLSGTLVQSFALWRFSSWRPAMYYNLSIAKRVGTFGLWLTLEGVLGWFYNWADSMLLGAFLGVKEFGLYHTGNIIIGMSFGFFVNPLLSILFPMFSRIQNDRKLLIKSFGKSVRLVTAVALPVAIGLFLLGDQIAGVLFGSKWAGLGRVISFLALVHGWAWFVSGVNSEAYKAIGRPDLSPKLMAFGMLYYLPVYFFAAPRGLETFLWARLLVCFLSLPIHIWVLSKIFGLSPVFLWKQSKISWVAAAAMGTAVFVIGSIIDINSPSWIRNIIVLGSIIGIGATIYIGTTVLLDRKYAMEIWALCRRAFVI